MMKTNKVNPFQLPQADSDGIMAHWIRQQQREIIGCQVLVVGAVWPVACRSPNRTRSLDEEVDEV
jgi:hypothetical protein